MKMIYLLLSLSFALQGLADDTDAVADYNRKSINLSGGRDSFLVESDEVSMVRTSGTARKIKVKMKVPLYSRVVKYTGNVSTCEVEGGAVNISKDRSNLARYGASCEYRSECMQYDRNNVCIRTRVERSCDRSLVELRVPGFTQGYVHVGDRYDTVRINLKKLPPLASGQKETMLLKAYQMKYNKRRVDFKLYNLATGTEYLSMQLLWFDMLKAQKGQKTNKDLDTINMGLESLTKN